MTRNRSHQRMVELPYIYMPVNMVDHWVSRYSRHHACYQYMHIWVRSTIPGQIHHSFINLAAIYCRHQPHSHFNFWPFYTDVHSMTHPVDHTSDKERPRTPSSGVCYFSSCSLIDPKGWIYSDYGIINRNVVLLPLPSNVLTVSQSLTLRGNHHCKLARIQMVIQRVHWNKPLEWCMFSSCPVRK